MSIDRHLNELADRVKLATIETCARVAELEGNQSTAKRIRALAGPNLTTASRDLDQAEPCPYCLPGTSTGLPGNACENCMNTGLKYPERAIALSRPMCADAEKTEGNQ